MAIDFSFSAWANYVAMASPYILVFYLIMSSIFMNSIVGIAKAGTYLGGILIATVIYLFLGKFITPSTGVPGATPRPSACSFMKLPFETNLDLFTAPAYNPMFVAFTLMYLLMPMVYSGNINWGLFVFLMVILVSDTARRFMLRCNSGLSLGLGIVLGGVLGFMWSGLWYMIKDTRSLLYYDDFVSNNVVCKRPKNQTFKCAVYKNGELVKNL